MSEEIIPAIEVKTEPNKTPAWVFYVLGIALFACFAQNLSWTFERWWNDEYYGHGLFVPVISAYLIIRQREHLRTLPRERCEIGIPVMVAGILLHAIATYINVNFPSGFAFIITFYGLIIWLWGWPIARSLAFPVAFLCFGVPIARLLVDRFAQPMQIMSAQWGGSFAAGLGIPTEVDGNVIHIPEYDFEVAVACSGLKSAISLTALGALYAYMLVAPIWKRVIVFATSLPVAIFANTGRIAITLVLGRLFGSVAAEGFLHSFSGVVVFLLAVLGLFGVGALLRCTQIRDDI